MSRDMGQLFDGGNLGWESSWSGHNGQQTVTGWYAFKTGPKLVNMIKFRQAPASNPAGKIDISYWAKDKWTLVGNSASPGYGNTACERAPGAEKVIRFGVMHNNSCHSS